MIAASALVFAGCGSSAALVSVKPTVIAHQSQLIAQAKHVGIQATSTAVASANATAVAVQVLASQAENRLRAQAHAQQAAQRRSETRPRTRHHRTQTLGVTGAPQSNKVPVAAPRPGVYALPTRVSQSPARPGVQLVSQPRPVTVFKPINHVHAWPTPVARPTSQSVPSVSSTTFTVLTCCQHHEYVRNGEVTSAHFASVGHWSLFADADCRNVHQAGVPLVSIATIPVGSHNPVSILRMSSALHGQQTVTRFHFYSGVYYLDLVTVCRSVKVTLAGYASRDAVRVFPAVLQSRAVAFAAVQGLAASFAQDRALMQAFIRQAAKNAAAARARARAHAHALALARARARFDASLQSIVHYSSSAADSLRLAQAYVDPSTPDYNPQYLDRAAGDLGSAVFGLGEAHNRLKRFTSKAGDLQAKASAQVAVNEYGAAARDLHIAIAMLEANNLLSSADHLKRADAHLVTGDAALKLAQGYLEGRLHLAKH